MHDIDQLLDSGEKVIWRAKPRKAVYVATKAVPFLFIVGFFALFFLPFCSSFLFVPLTAAGVVSETGGDGAAAVSGFVGFAICALLPFVGVFGSIALSAVLPLFAYRHVEYLLTNKRALLADGVIGRDYKSVDYDKMQNIEVNVGLFDKLFGGGNTGSISLFSGEMVATKHGPRATKDSMIGIEDPYTVFKLLKQVSHDIKTDIEYPNEMRPATNPGYKTEYKTPDQKS